MLQLRKLQDSILGQKFKKNNVLLFYMSVIMLVISNYRLIIFRLENTFNIGAAYKDEIGFLSSYLNFKNNGWYQSVSDGCSPLFNLATLLINYFINDPVYAMRTVSVFAMILTILIWTLFTYKHTSFAKGFKILVFLFFINVILVRQAYFTATDDPLFILFISLAFMAVYIGIKSNYKQNIAFVLGGLSFAAAAATRPLFVFYISGFLLVFLILLLKQQNFFKSILLFFLSFLTLLSFVHYPSLIEKRKLSVHNKDFIDIDVKWSEMDYIFLLRNKEKLLYGRNNKLKPTPEEVVQYRKDNGENSTPKTYIESIKMIPKDLYVKNYIGLLYLQALPFLRQIGLFYPFFIILSFFYLYRKKNNKSSMIFPLIFYVLFTLSHFIIPIVHLEFRRFMLFIPLVTSFSFIFIQDIFVNYREVKYSLIYMNIILIGILNALYIGLW